MFKARYFKRGLVSLSYFDSRPLRSMTAACRRSKVAHFSGFTVLAYLTDEKGKSKVFPDSLPSIGPGADPGVQAVSPQVT